MRYTEFMLNEDATAGATSAGNIAIVTNPGVTTKTKVKQPKNKDGTAKNALDMDANIFGHKIVKRY